MADDPAWRLLVPAPIRQLPADLAAVVVMTLATVLAIATPVVNETPLRVILGLPFVLFLPGYALVAALFPEAGASPADENATEETDAASSTTRDGIDGIERVALSFGLSIAVVPLLGLVLNFTPFGIRLAPVVVAVAGFTLLLTAVASYRRHQLPPDSRFAVPYRDWLHAIWEEFTNPDSGLDSALNILLVISILLAVSSVAYAVAVPKQGESFTEFYLLTEQDNGTLVADDYPTEFTAGEPQPIVVGIGNHEHRTVEYSLVVEIQDVRIQNNTTTVLEETELQRLQATVENGDTRHLDLNVSTTQTGQRLRLAFMLFEGEPPAEPSVENAYRETHLWVNVSAPS